MSKEDEKVSIVREHIGWARTYAIFWFAMCLLIFGAADAMAEFIGLNAELRTPMFLMIGTIIIVTVVWQAMGLLIIRLEKVVLPRIARP
jgi:hypothetical protein